MKKNGAVTEIRWHGRGGQGAKTAAIVMAEAALEEGKYCQGFPDYGPERMGAPIRSYNRISEEPILLYSPVISPSLVVVLDATLIALGGVTDGLTDGGLVLVNTTATPAEIRESLGMTGDPRGVYSLDATGIALEEIGRPIPNAPMIGALAKVSGVLNPESLIHSLRHKFEGKLSAKAMEGNVRAVMRATEEVQEG
jgi:pyruvate ferredoxin oxidoreductase gamma subunit